MGQTHVPVGCSMVSACPAGAGRLPGAVLQSSGAAVLARLLGAPGRPGSRLCSGSLRGAWLGYL